MRFQVIQQRVLKTIQKHQLIVSGDRVLIALSAGADSICLTTLLHRLSKQLDIRIEIAHLNHRLRGQDSERDAEFVVQYGGKIDIKTHIEAVDLKKFARRKKMSLETAGRLQRYDFLQRTADKIGATKIATAHTADDQVETIIMRWLRGSGARGLAGIPYRRGNIIRPLLDVKKNEILQYLTDHNQSFCEDVSNTRVDFTRNKIRHRLLPLLEKEYYAGISRRIRQSADIFRMIEEFLQAQVKQYAQKNCHSIKEDQIKLDLSEFFDYPDIVQIELIRWCVDHLSAGSENWTLKHYFDCLDLASNEKTGRERHFPGSVIVHRSYDRLVFSLSQPDFGPYHYQLMIPGCVHICEAGVKIESQILLRSESDNFDMKSDNRILADLDLLSQPITIRNRQPGDRIHLYGNGRKKVKDVFIEAKVPRREREKIPLVFSGPDLLWIAGYRRGSLAPISEQTDKVVLFEIKQFIRRKGCR